MARSPFLIASLAWVLGCAPTPVASSAGDTLAIQAVYDSIAAGIEACDIDRVSAHSAPDAQVEYADGRRLDLRDWKESARAKWANFKSAESAFAVTSVQPNEAGAVVTYLETDSMVVVDPATSQQHHVEYQGEWCAQLLRTEGGWRLYRSVEQGRRVKLDGKLVDETQRKP